MMANDGPGRTGCYAGAAAMTEYGVDAGNLLLGVERNGMVRTNGYAEPAAGTMCFVNLGGDRLNLECAAWLETGQGIADTGHPLQHCRPDIHGFLAGAGEIYTLDVALGSIHPSVQFPEEIEWVATYIQHGGKPVSSLRWNHGRAENNHIR